ncbi:MAG: iron-containing alcohol dehydrogenase [Chloroflexi bacterium]|nr:iron-containing alcohol dehydrogenase [Chloroflexota bacterium]
MYEPLRSFELGLPGRVLFGIGMVQRIGQEAADLGLQDGLLVTDPGVAGAGLVQKVTDPLKAAGIHVDVYDQAETEPGIASIEALLELVRSRSYGFLVGLGGGSAMDTAKAVAVLMTNPGEPEDYFAGGKRQFSKPGLPCIAIPTTAGTGAEVTWDSVVKDRTGTKAFFEHRYVRPAVAIVDPLMSAGMPPRLTASSGIDALAHAVESFLTKLATPITQALALQSIRLISANLRLAVHQGDNLEARYNMALATLTEGLSETNAGDIEAHAFGHLIGSRYKIPHGIACGVILPYAIDHNLAIMPERVRLIAEAMGEPVDGLPVRKAASLAAPAVEQLIREVGLPTTLQEAEIPRQDLRRLAADAVTIPWISVIFESFTVRTMTAEVALDLLTNCWKGNLVHPA